MKDRINNGNHEKTRQNTGTLYDRSPASAKGYTVNQCKGGYLRAYENTDSLMLVLRPKKQQESEE